MGNKVKQGFGLGVSCYGVIFFNAQEGATIFSTKVAENNNFPTFQNEQFLKFNLLLTLIWLKIS